VLAPASVQEAIDMMQNAFDLADIYRTPVMVLADGIIGQMMEPVEFHESGKKRELPEKTWASTGWSPSSGRPRAIVNSLYITTEELDCLNQRLQSRYREIEKNEVLVEKYNTEDAEYILCAYGTVARICKSAISLLEKEGVKVGLVRPITLWPFPSDAVRKAAEQDSVKALLTVEISAGQMFEDVRLAVNGKKETAFFGRPGSYVPGAEEICEAVLRMRRARQ
jgi:2-oxoglutarate ferredoxin oxidoreductase subunit alpha